MSAKNINKNNILDKISFCLFGGGLSQFGQLLRDSLLNYRNDEPYPAVTRQTIYYWFAKGSAPSREGAFRLLLHFINANFAQLDKTPDQIKVYYQIEEYLKATISSIDNNPREISNISGVLSTPKGGILIENSMDDKDILNISESWKGTYICYRLRLTPVKKKNISCEVVRVSLRNKDISYQHWHLDDTKGISSFEGYGLSNSQSLWLFGSNSYSKRLRICHFRRNDPSSIKYRRVRWGLMHSDIPISSSYEPASERIVLILAENKIENFQDFLKNTVKYTDIEDVKLAHREIVRRAIDNRESAHSRAGTTIPLEEPDQILQVDQRTTDGFCELT
jgi:hypothetical protein